jgi:hypothetical protein
MTLKENLELIKTKMFDLISVSEITFLKEMDNRININKFGKYCHKNLDFGYNKIWRFLNGLDDNKIYVLIPLISRNNRPDQPYIVLSQQILVSNNSNATVITEYITSKFDEMVGLYEFNDTTNLQLTFKYKLVDVNFNEHSKF